MKEKFIPIPFTEAKLVLNKALNSQSFIVFWPRQKLDGIH